MKIQHFCTFWLLTTLISREKLWKLFWWKNSSKHNGFPLFVFWQLWLHVKNRGNYFDEKIVKTQRFCTVCPLITLISRNKIVKKFLMKKRIAKTQRFCTIWLLTTLISRKNYFDEKITKTILISREKISKFQMRHFMLIFKHCEV